MANPECLNNCPYIKVLHINSVGNAGALFFGPSPHHLRVLNAKELSETIKKSDSCPGPKKEVVERRVGFLLFNRRTVRKEVQVCGLKQTASRQP